MHFPSYLTKKLQYGRIEVCNWEKRCYKTCNGHAHLDSNFWSFPIAFKDGNRFDAPATVENLDNAVRELQNHIKECETALTQFDDEYKEWTEIENLIKQYDEKYSGYIRGYFDSRR